MKYAIERLKQYSEPEWDTNIIEFKNGSYRINYLNYPGIWLSVRPTDLNTLGLEINLVMQNAMRLKLSDMHKIISTTQLISKVCEAKTVVYKES